MTAIAKPDIHDAETLAAARTLLDNAQDPEQMQREVLQAVARNEQWLGKYQQQFVADLDSRLRNLPDQAYGQHITSSCRRHQ